MNVSKFRHRFVPKLRLIYKISEIFNAPSFQKLFFYARQNDDQPHQAGLYLNVVGRCVPGVGGRVD